MSTLLHALTHLADHDRLFLACSGGRDSLSLAYACYLLHQDGKLPALPTLLHVHHGIQRANDDWATHVHAWAIKHGFVCHILPLELDKKSETTARTARYQAMMDVMSDDDVLLLAHHEADQAETLLMRLINGTGIHGLSGIKTWQNKTLHQKTVRLHRPWLHISREAITDFAHAHALPYVDDPTNDSLDNTRSFIRNDILPKLKHINPKAPTNIARCATLVRQSCTILEPVIARALDTCQCHTMSDLPYQSVLDIHALSAFDTNHQSAILHAWLGMGEPVPPPSHLIGQIIALCQRQNLDQQTQIFWQGKHGHIVCRYRHHLYRFWDKAWAYLHGHSDSVMLMPAPHARLLNNTDKVPVDVHGVVRHLHGKKLYQTLGIAPFFRKHLYIMDNEHGSWLIAPYQSWQLSGVPQHVDGLVWQMR